MPQKFKLIFIGKNPKIYTMLIFDVTWGRKSWLDRPGEMQT